MQTFILSNNILYHTSGTKREAPHKTYTQVMWQAWVRGHKEVIYPQLLLRRNFKHFIKRETSTISELKGKKRWSVWSTVSSRWWKHKRTLGLLGMPSLRNSQRTEGCGLYVLSHNCIFKLCLHFTVSCKFILFKNTFGCSELYRWVLVIVSALL